MRVELAIAGVSLLLIVAGQGVLLALGVTRLRVRTLLASCGLAYLAGVASTLLVGVLLLVLGIGFPLPLFAVVALLFGAAGAAIALRRPRSAEAGEGRSAQAPASRAQRLVVVAVGAILVAVMVSGLLDAGVRTISDWDAWSIWMRKAVVLTYNGLDPRVFAASPYSFAHLDYPILLPLFESVHFRAMGTTDGQPIHAAFWLMYVACLGSVAYLGSRFTRVWVWLPAVLALALGSQFNQQLLTAYADVPLGLLTAIGVLSVGLWLAGRGRRYLALGCLLLAAAASIKNEGSPLVFAIFASAAIVLAVGRAWRSLMTLAIGVVCVVAALAPWRIWVHAHHIKAAFPIVASPSYLFGHLDRFWSSVKLLGPLFETDALSYVVPLALALVIAGLATRGLRRVAAFYLLAAVGSFASVIWALVITPASVHYQPSTPARIIMGTVFVLFAALVHLAGALDGYGGERRGLAASGPERSSYEANSEPVGV